MGFCDKLRAKLFMLFPLLEIGDNDLIEEKVKDIYDFLKKNNFTELEIQALKLFGNFIEDKSMQILDKIKGNENSEGEKSKVN